MMLAARSDLEFPHIDWECKECGMVYCSAGYPDDNRCLDGHGAGWKPESDQLEEYISLLESLGVGDGVLFAGNGPAALMAPVEEVGENYVIAESIDSPRRKIRWDSEDLTIEQKQLEEEHAIWQEVYHVDTVEVAVHAE